VNNGARLGISTSVFVFFFLRLFLRRERVRLFARPPRVSKMGEETQAATEPRQHVTSSVAES